MKNAPCYQCKDRYPGCHDKCQKEEYLKLQARKHIIYEAKCREARGRATTEHWKDLHSAKSRDNE